MGICSHFVESAKLIKQWSLVKQSPLFSFELPASQILQVSPKPAADLEPLLFVFPPESADGKCSEMYFMLPVAGLGLCVSRFLDLMQESN